MNDKQTFHITSIELGVDADFVRSFTTEATNHREALQHYIDHLNSRPRIEPWVLDDFIRRVLEDTRVPVYNGVTLHDATDSNTEVYVVITEADKRQEI